ncbi:nitrile hydratase accessory protein [Pimelobacter simplex]|uniref:Nitrile hydratase accessory protein n=1 Tax=Nocardioides simplex TaxID=2045 RepID=A0A7J5E2N5_NOCSI|nr:nitrile hydratase accessory protein [Pimelobacter simplex]KAB2812506.1 nitrile hydratase accessory protein [Pimelobacter simplex]
MLPAPYADPADVAADRSRVEALVCGLPAADPEQLSFEHPWEIRAFAMAVSAHRELGFDWTDFQQALVASIDGWEASTAVSDRGWSYYEHWVAALESVLGGLGLLGAEELARQTRDVLALPANRNHHEAHTEPIAVDPARAAHL